MKRSSEKFQNEGKLSEKDGQNIQGHVMRRQKLKILVRNSREAGREEGQEENILVD